MTQVAGNPRSDRPSPPTRHEICPFLLADSGWRSASPVKEHRCLALGPDVPLALEKQRRLCLTAEHRVCPAYTTALGRAESEDGAAPGAPPRRPYPRMAPVVLDHGRMSVSLPAAARERPAGQLALGALMVVAFAAIALARLGDGGEEGGVAAVAPSPSPRASVAAVAPSPPPAPTPEPSPSIAPSSATPASAAPDPTPTPPLRTYTMKRGDTLIKVGARFGTTVKALMALNNIDDPQRIPVGAVLKIPPEAP